jgi:hypothetical protein
MNVYNGCIAPSIKRPIKAELRGSRQCEAQGIVAAGQAPALVLCRELLAAWGDPGSSLAVYRNGIVSLRIRSIRDGAGLTVEDGETGIQVRP